MVCLPFDMAGVMAHTHIAHGHIEILFSHSLRPKRLLCMENELFMATVMWQETK